MNFDYIQPSTLIELLEVKQKHGDKAMILAGGTDLLIKIRAGVLTPTLLVDIKRIEECIAITRNGNLIIGAAANCTDIYNSEALHNFSAITDSTRILGSIQIQSRASLGGNLCNSSPSADAVPALIVHDAVAILSSTNTTREVLVNEFCTGPGKNVMAEDEVLVKFELPIVYTKQRSSYIRFIPRNEMDIAVAGVAVSVMLNENEKTVKRIKISLAGVAPTAVTLLFDNLMLKISDCNEYFDSVVVEKIEKVVSPITDMRGTVEHKSHLSQTIARRALQKALERVIYDK